LSTKIGTKIKTKNAENSRTITNNLTAEENDQNSEEKSCPYTQ
jgi:hypothetical protein